MDHLRELLPFLHDPNPQVRQLAVSALLEQTPSGSPNRSIFFHGINGLPITASNPDTPLIRDLKLLCRDQAATAHDTFRALVNLSDSSLLAPSLSEVDFLTFVVSYVLSPSSLLADLASMLLSNLTAHPQGATAFINFTIPCVYYPTAPALEKFYFPAARSATSVALPHDQTREAKSISAMYALVDAFTSAAAVTEQGSKDASKRKGDLHFISSVFANISVIPAGRLFFLTPYMSRLEDLLKPSSNDEVHEMEYPLAKLISFTEHPNMIRRGGVASVVKNCAFHVPSHRALLSPETSLITIAPSTVEAPGINILPSILLPLAGPEEFSLEDQELLPISLQLLPPDKARESDAVLRLTHVETLLLLCTNRWGRDFLRENGVYQVVRAAHEVESDDRVSEHIERLVNLLQRDEGPETAKDEGHLDEDDDDDDKIVEV